MYAQFRNELMVMLADLNGDILEKVFHALDCVASGYTMQKTETQMIVYDGGLPDVCKAYLVSRSIEGLSDKTMKLYKNVLTTFFSMISKPVNKINANDIRVWIYRYEEQNGVSKRSMDLYRSVLSGFFKWAAAEGWMDEDPCASIKPIKYVKKPRKAMSQIELEYIREACETVKETAIIELLYSTGCRVSQIGNIKLGDINWQRKEVQVFGKGGKYRTAYLNAKAVVAIHKYLESRDDDNKSLIVSTRAPHNPMTKSGIENMVRKITSRVQDKLSVKVTPHVFRHTTATSALAHGMPIQDVQMMLGHRNINTTMVYAQVDTSEVKTMHTKCVV